MHLEQLVRLVQASHLVGQGSQLVPLPNAENRLEFPQAFVQLTLLSIEKPS